MKIAKNRNFYCRLHQNAESLLLAFTNYLSNFKYSAYHKSLLISNTKNYSLKFVVANPKYEY